MISFLQRFLQKHNKWLFSALLLVIVISFVFTIGASPGLGRAKRKPVYFFGQDLTNSAQMKNISENAVYAAMLEGQNLDITKHNFDFFVARRIICLGLAKELFLPIPTQKLLRNYMRSLPAFLDDNGRFSKDLYNSAVKAFERNGCGRDRLKKILCENLMIKQVNDALFGDTFVSSDAIVAHFAKLFTKYDFSVVRLEPSSIAVDINVSGNEVERVYDKCYKNCEQPKIYKISIVNFNNVNFERDIPPPSESEKLEFFEKYAGEFDPDVNFEKVKNSIHKGLVSEKARLLAHQAAGDFINELYENSIKPGSVEFLKVIENLRGELKSVPLFSEKDTSVSKLNSSEIANILDLDENRYFSEPVFSEFGEKVYVLEQSFLPKDLTLSEAKPLILSEIIKKRRQEATANTIKLLQREISDALDGNFDPKNVLDSHKLPVESYDEISLMNAVQKGIPPEYIGLLSSLGAQEKVRVLSSEDENQGAAQIFFIRKKMSATNENLTKEKFLEIEFLLRNFRKNLLQVDFFNSQMLKLVR